MQLYTRRELFSGSSLLEDLNFNSVSGLYKNFTRMSPSEFEFLIDLIGERISKKNTAFRKAISVQESLARTHSSTGLFTSFPSSSHSICFLILLKCIECFGSHIISFLLLSSINSLTVPSVRSISQLPKRPTNRTAPLIKTDASGMYRRAEERTVVTCHVARPYVLRP